MRTVAIALVVLGGTLFFFGAGAGTVWVELGIPVVALAVVILSIVLGCGLGCRDDLIERQTATAAENERQSSLAATCIHGERAQHEKVLDDLISLSGRLHKFSDELASVVQVAALSAEEATGYQATFTHGDVPQPKK